MCVDCTHFCLFCWLSLVLLFFLVITAPFVFLPHSFRYAYSSLVWNIVSSIILLLLLFWDYNPIIFSLPSPSHPPKPVVCSFLFNPWPLSLLVVTYILTYIPIQTGPSCSACIMYLDICFQHLLLPLDNQSVFSSQGKTTPSPRPPLSNPWLPVVLRVGRSPLRLFICVSMCFMFLLGSC